MIKIVLCSSLFLYACDIFQKKQKSHSVLNLLQDSWQYCTKSADYQLVEFSDSAYIYYEQGEWAGTSRHSYYVNGDSLILENDTDTMRWLINRIDSKNMVLVMKLDTLTFQRIRIDLPLDNYSYFNENDYARQFKELKSRHQCN